MQKSWSLGLRRDLDARLGDEICDLMESVYEGFPLLQQISPLLALKRASISVLPLSLLDQHKKFVLKSRKLHSFPILGHFWIQNSEKYINLGVYFQT